MASSESFSKGEIAIYIGCPGEFRSMRTNAGGDLSVGSEVTVITDIHPRRATNVSGNPVMDVYIVRTQDGRELGARPSWLRKRRPPQDWVKLCRLDEVKHEEPSYV